MEDRTQAVPKMPETIIDMLWADVTAKSKSIAMSQMFGPEQDSGIHYMLKLLSENATEAEVAEMRAYIERVRVAKEPEDVRAAH